MPRIARLIIYEGTEAELDQVVVRSLAAGIHRDKRPKITVVPVPTVLLLTLEELGAALVQTGEASS